MPKHDTFAQPTPRSVWTQTRWSQPCYKEHRIYYGFKECEDRWFETLRRHCAVSLNEHFTVSPEYQENVPIITWLEIKASPCGPGFCYNYFIKMRELDFGLLLRKLCSLNEMLNINAGCGRKCKLYVSGSYCSNWWSDESRQNIPCSHTTDLGIEQLHDVYPTESCSQHKLFWYFKSYIAAWLCAKGLTHAD